MIAGHTHRVANTVINGIPVVEGVNAGGSYSVAQLMVKNGDVAWAGAATRIAKNLGVAPRPDVQAIVDKANADTAALRNEVIGTQTRRLCARPDRLKESNMGNLVADAMRAKYPGRRGGDHQLRRPARRTSWCTPPTAGEAAGRDHLGRGVRRAAVRQPHGDRDADRRAAHGGARERVQAAVRRRGAAAPAARRRSRA